MGKNKKKRGPLTGESLVLVDELMAMTTQPEISDMPGDLLESFVKIHDLVGKISGSEKSFEEVPKRDEELLQQMVDWGIRYGCYVRSIAVRKLPNEDEYGVFCTENLQDADIFLSVPLDLMMSSDFAMEKTTLGSLLKEDPICSKMANVSLALFLLDELAKGPQSFWTFYIRCLPARYCTILYFNEADMKLLSGTTALDESCRMYRSIARQFAYFKRKMVLDQKWKQQPLAKLFTYESYRWACSTVMTRQNELPSLKPGRKQMALVPLWDMCNHSNLRSGTDYDVASQQLVSFATKSYSPGEEVNIFYGNRPNADFMIHNGFVPESNRWDSVCLKIGLSKSDKLYEMKKGLCEKMKIPPVNIFELKKTPENDGVLVPKILLQLIYILQWKAPEDPGASKTKGETADGNGEGELTDPARTKKAMLYLQQRCAILMKSMPKPVEELQEMLNDQTETAVSAEHKLAIRYRLSEHEMLSKAVQKIVFTV